MSFVFDLSAYEDAREHGAEILERVSEGSMPCDARWPAEKVELLQAWVSSGMPP
jgi:hypothetical protein